ncbi:MAG: dTDP-4-dehydrorhamnose reductase [Myxococcota bacterium]
MSPDGPRTASGARLRIGVLGAAGQIGRCLVRSIGATADLEFAFAVTRAELDLAELDRIGPWLDGRHGAPPDCVVNAAAFTKVDACESQPELAHRMNAQMPGAWARALRQRDVAFVHLSTDYVFPGDGHSPYREDDPTGPRSVYGRTKLEGERAVLEADPSALVVRTSWVFGPGRNFVLAILDQAAKRRRGEATGPLRVVDDQQGRPTAAADLAEALVALCRLRARSGREPRGCLHVCNEGVATWYGFARAILDQAGYGDVAIEPVATGVFPTAAPRPAYSVLATGKAAGMGITLRPWTEALAGYLAGPDRPTSLIADRPLSSGPEPADPESATPAPALSDPVRRKVPH